MYHLHTDNMGQQSNLSMIHKDNEIHHWYTEHTEQQ